MDKEALNKMLTEVGNALFAELEKREEALVEIVKNLEVDLETYKRRLIKETLENSRIIFASSLEEAKDKALKVLEKKLRRDRQVHLS
jgi:hypothetical protein